MSYFETNLGKANTYHRVTAPFPVFHYTGQTKGTNVYVGSCQILERITELRDVEVGGEIHNLHGGLFYVAPSRKVTEVVLALDKKGPLEKRYMPDQHVWPLDKLQQIPAFERTLVANYRGGE